MPLTRRPGGPARRHQPLPPLSQVNWGAAWRAIKIGVHKPFILAATIVVALIAAVCWGGNIAAVYPIFEVTMRGESLVSWADKRIASSESALAALATQREQLAAAHAAGDAAAAAQSALRQLDDQIAAEQSRLRTTQFMLPYIRAYLPTDPFNTVVLIVAFVAAMTIIKSFCHVAHQYFACRLTQGITFDLRMQFFESVLKSDAEINLNRGAGQLWTRFTQEIPFVAQGLTGLFGRSVGEPLKIVACLAAAAYINWRLLLISLMVAPFAGWAIASLAKRMKARMASEADQAATINQMLFEIILGLPIVQAYTMEPLERDRLRTAALDCWHKSSRAVMFRAMCKPAVEVLGLGIVCCAMLTGAHLVLNQGLTLFGIPIADRALDFPALLVFLGLLVGAYDPLRKLGDTSPQLLLGLTAAERVFAIIDTTPTITEPAQPIAVARPHSTLRMEGVEFHYRPHKPVLQDVNLSVVRGETIAIVGPNGCGKSTLAGLIPRFHDAVKGSIRLDGVDVRDMAITDVRQRIGIVTQVPHLFDDTVLNNIRYGKPDATLDEIVAAARQAHAHEFIERDLADGYYTQVGRGGGRLSGGQRQRIAFARAILRNPEILILDEPTSQIDVESERLIIDTLKTLIHGRTVILITHRPAMLELADRTLVMNRGRILHVGTHAELMSSSPQYRQLQHTAPLAAPAPKAA